MRYLITGGAGFIGSHLADRLLEQGNDVIALDNLSTGRLDNIRQLEANKRFDLAYGDVTNRQLVDKCAKCVDRVFHLASPVGVRLIVEDPIRAIETNIYGTAEVFSACERYRLPVLLTSTSEVYGKSDRIPYSEDEDCVIGSPVHSRWAYACVKALDEFLAVGYWRQTGLAAITVRLFNTAGPRQTGHYGMVIPSLIDQALAGEALDVYGDGRQTRCFCHVQDAVSALIALMDRHEETAGEIFNVGTAEQITINDLAKKILEMTGSPAPVNHVPYEEAYGEGFEDMRHRVPRLDKIRERIGYEPQYDLTAILRDMIAEAKGHSRGSKPGAADQGSSGE